MAGRDQHQEGGGFGHVASTGRDKRRNAPLAYRNVGKVLDNLSMPCGQCLFV